MEENKQISSSLKSQITRDMDKINSNLSKGLPIASAGTIAAVIGGLSVAAIPAAAIALSVTGIAVLAISATKMSEKNQPLRKNLKNNRDKLAKIESKSRATKTHLRDHFNYATKYGVKPALSKAIKQVKKYGLSSIFEESSKKQESKKIWKKR